MNPSEYETMYRLEREYWWFQARYAFMESLLLQYLPSRAPGSGLPKILDLACGTGEVMNGLGRVGQTIGIDLSETALQFCRRRDLRLLIQGRAEALPVASASVDVVICLDAFEHVRDDVGSLSECFRVLRPGGVLITGVPALGFLWSEHDEALHHLRRYSRREFRRKLKHQGFEVSYLSYAFFLLFWPALVLRTMQSFLKDCVEPRTQLYPVSSWFNDLLIFWHRMEAWLLGRVNLPIGLSLFAVARRPTSPASEAGA